MIMQKYISSIGEAAKLLGCSRQTVHRLIKQGLFPEPVIEMRSNNAKFRFWSISSIQNYKAKLRPAHRPKATRKDCVTKN